MFKLNLPECNIMLSKRGESLYVFDQIRKKHIKLTPEEWVRQHFVSYLTTHLHYPKSVIKVENGLRFSKLQKRADILVFDGDGNPHILIECKAPHIALSAHTIQQISAYHHTLQPKFIALTNGLNHFFFKTGEKICPVENLPSYNN